MLPIFISVAYFIYAVLSHWSSFTLTYSQAQYSQMYADSQYIHGENATKKMGDGDLYVFAGLQYLKGESPTKINFEHPPLGKVLYGLSYLASGYPNLILIPLYCLFIFCFWQITKEISFKQPTRYLALFLLLSHSTLSQEITRTMLDFPQTVLLLFLTFVYLKLNKHQNLLFVCLVGVSAGLLFLIKYPLPLVLGYYLLLLLFSKRRGLPNQYLFLILILTGITYLLGYLNYFLQGGSPLEYIKFEWWRWRWYQGKTDLPHFLLLSVIFLGRYRRWWESNSYTLFPHWNIYWPISLILFILSTKNINRKTFSSPLFPYQLWSFITLLILLYGVYEDRFLMPIIPAFAIFGASSLKSVILSIKTHMR